MKHLNRTVLSLTLAAALGAAAAGTALAEPVAKAASPSFKDYDSNGDGKVSQEEFRALGGDEQAFRKADANRDNQLSSEEFTKVSANETRS
jgi:Ca2+-binding EF-hand superfamily protein